MFIIMEMTVKRCEFALDFLNLNLFLYYYTWYFL